MNFIFCKLKNLKKDGFHCLQALKNPKNMNFIFYKLKNLKKHNLFKSPFIEPKRLATHLVRKYIGSPPKHQITLRQMAFVNEDYKVKNFNKHELHFLQA